MFLPLAFSSEIHYYRKTMSQGIFQTIVVLASFFLVFFWSKSAFTSYTPILLGGLTLLYLITSFLHRKQTSLFLTKGPKPLTVFLLTTLVVLIINLTGSINSDFFFLFYFLSFAISYLFHSEMVFVLCFAILLFFFPTMESAQTITNFIKIASLFLLAPIAYFFGKEIELREKREQQQSADAKTVTKATESIMNDVATIVKNEGKSLKETDITALKDIVTQSKRVREKI